MNRRDWLGFSFAGAGGAFLSASLPAHAYEMVLKDLQELDTLPYFERNSRGKLVLCEGVADK
ncbi:MAG: hypothetical protein R6V10_09945, partial [bacterium]